MRGIASALFLAACSTGPTEVEDPSPAEGGWAYEALQTLPETRAIEGTVTWFSVSGGAGSFEGTYHLVEELPEGGYRSLIGIGSGVILADTVADFDLDIGGTQRRHIGILRSDSIVGGWVDLRSGGASGNFVLRKGG